MSVLTIIMTTSIYNVTFIYIACKAYLDKSGLHGLYYNIIIHIVS